jgi:hypothetical protein
MSRRSATTSPLPSPRPIARKLPPRESKRLVRSHSNSNLHLLHSSLQPRRFPSLQRIETTTDSKSTESSVFDESRKTRRSQHKWQRRTISLLLWEIHCFGDCRFYSQQFWTSAFASSWSWTIIMRVLCYTFASLAYQLL